jgi:hypothetical protein
LGSNRRGRHYHPNSKKEMGWIGNTVRKPADDLTRYALQSKPQGKMRLVKKRNSRIKECHGQKPGEWHRTGQDGVALWRFSR